MKARDLIAGLLFFGAAAVILYFAVTLGGIGQAKWPWQEKDVEYTITFPRVTGLTPNSPVWVSGVPKGTVKAMYVDPNTAKVDVKITLDPAMRPHMDTFAEIVSSSAFGGRAVSLELGDPATGDFDPKSGQKIRGEVVDDIFTAAGRSIGKLDQGIVIAIDTLKEVNAIVKDVRSGRGPIGTVLYDEKMAGDITATVENVRDISSDGKVISGDIREITRKINSGDGPAAFFLQDPEAAIRIRNILRNIDTASGDASGATRGIRAIVEKTNDGRGVLGALVNDEPTGEHIKSIIAKTDDTMTDVGRTFKATGDIVSDVREGKGSVGKIFKNDTLYNDILNSLNTLRAGFEDIREQAPITTFASLLFQVFQ
ncbi:MAG: MCE family protein [Planctomycetes bacterium]|nr:MCE family protein [Planctomycetota bacterium]